MPSGSPERGLLVRLFESAGYRVEDRPAGLRFLRRRDARAVFLVDGRIIAEMPDPTAERVLDHLKKLAE